MERSRKISVSDSLGISSLIVEPFQANTLWRGLCSEASCSDIDIALQIKEKTPENKFEGIVSRSNLIPNI